MRSERYDRLAEELIRGNSTVSHGTMMGFPCLRMEGRFFASLDRGTGRLILKLPADRVAELVGSGTGLPFAPNGRVFREWVALDEASDWDTVAREALSFASGE